jgi:hypothetical protein
MRERRLAAVDAPFRDDPVAPADAPESGQPDSKTE